MEQSIKSQVIALAQADPFLTVKDLAVQVGTTTRYVRTILSEAQLSLHEMRRDYARRLERNRSKPETQEFDIQEELTIAKVPGGSLGSAVEAWAELELFRASTVYKSSSLIYYAELFTPEQLRIPASHGSLRELLPRDILASLEVSKQKAEVLSAPAALIAVLNLPKQSQALKLTTLLMAEEEPIALEIKWLGLEHLILEWSRPLSEVKAHFGK